jgi:hypothetical protein
MQYVDVFISHKFEDLAACEALADRVSAWGFSCYIDGRDAELFQEGASPRAVAERIRQNLRFCQCLVFAYSSRSPKSHWMPWELGFFDGRWGPRQIGLYDLDPAEARNPEQDKQEYLQIYDHLGPDTLRPFLERACSARAMSDRVDADVDRLAAWITGAMRNPADFAVGCLQFNTSLMGALAQGALGVAPHPQTPLPGMFEAYNGLLQRWREALRPLDAGQAGQQLTGVAVDAGRDALEPIFVATAANR